MRGNAFLAQGHNRMAASTFEQQIAANPENADAHVGLGIARARLGRCKASLEELLPWEHAISFGAKTALLAARCSLEEGYPADALYFDLYAQHRRPESGVALSRIVLDADRMGDRVLRDVAREYLWYVNPNRDESMYVDAALALRAGDVGEFDTMVALWNRESRPSEELVRLEAQSWLDLDDAPAALAAFKGSRHLRRGTEARLLLAEACRRTGSPDEALRSLDSKISGRLPGSAADSIRIRILVDQGEVAAAQALLADYAAEDDEEIVAARWYVARARGDARGMAAQAEAYEERVSSPMRNLGQYVPIDQQSR